MSWICPYCGNENENDERVGREEPHCRCGEERTSPEDLEKLKETNVGVLESAIDDINWKISPVVDQISSLEDELSNLQIELKELQEEREPLKTDLKKWEDLTVHYEKRDKAFVAEQDPHQAKLPFEGVPA